jgi:hypothetical protein
MDLPSRWALLDGCQVGPVERAKGLQGHSLQPMVRIRGGLILLNQSINDVAPTVSGGVLVSFGHDS